MANYKRGKTKTKTYDGDGFNKTKDRDATSAKKGKGIPAKKSKKRFGLRIEYLYHSAWVRQIGMSNPLIYTNWYATEKGRDEAMVTLKKNEPEIRKTSRTASYTKIER